MSQLRSEIAQFRQLDFEPLYEAWERFKDLIRRCPQHGYQEWFQVQLFYNGLNGYTRTIVDATAGGFLLSKTAREANQLLDEMAANNYQWPNERNTTRRVADMHEIDQIMALTTQVSALTNKLSSLMANDNSSIRENMARASTSYGLVEDQSEWMNYNNNQNFNYQNHLPNYYHPGLRTYENFSYGNNRSILQTPSGFNNAQAEKESSLEELMRSFITEARERFNKNKARIDEIEMHFVNMGATMKTLDTQIGQLVSALKEQSSRKFPSDTEINPKEHRNAITMRSSMKEETQHQQLEEDTAEKEIIERMEHGTSRITTLGEYTKEKMESIPVIDVSSLNTQGCHHEEPMTNEENAEIFHDDSLSEKGLQDTIIKEELQEGVFVAQLNLPHSKALIQDHIYEDPMWQNSPPPNIRLFLQAYQVQAMKLNQVDRIFPYHANLKGNHSQEPLVVSYDTYYGHKPLFDESFKKSSWRHKIKR